MVFLAAEVFNQDGKLIAAASSAMTIHKAR
jgi:hypothetical protein